MSHATHMDESCLAHTRACPHRSKPPSYKINQWRSFVVLNRGLLGLLTRGLLGLLIQQRFSSLANHVLFFTLQAEERKK